MRCRQLEPPPEAPPSLAGGSANDITVLHWELPTLVRKLSYTYQLNRRRPRLLPLRYDRIRLFQLSTRTALTYRHLPLQSEMDISQSAQNSQGINTLLEAEKNASKIVQQAPTTTATTTSHRPRLTPHLPSPKTAREYRTKRVREARDEAKKEIDAYRKEKEDEFKKFESEHAQGNKQAEDEASKEADAKIQEIKGAGKKSQEKVVADLLKAVFDVKPVPPTTVAA
ncbi:hypothetical protein TruAng_005036 [Truncatella angustata]|nr:hypothetical protein TruAng_005036 [Truncatella angustata]